MKNSVEGRRKAEARLKAIRLLKRAAHTKTCRYCGGPFEVNRIGPYKVYCSRKCRRYYNEEKHDTKEKTTPTRPVRNPRTFIRTSHAHTNMARKG